MNERLPDAVYRGAAAPTIKFLLQQNGYVVVLAILLVSLWITGGALSKSYLIGRLADPITHNDVNYLIDGIQRLLYVEINGFWAELWHLFKEPMHAPYSGYQAALGFYLFGFHDWAPYASNIVYLWILFAVCVALLRGCPTVVTVATVIALAGMPLLYTTISEFAPEIPLGVFAALGVLLTLRICLLERAIWPRAIAGFCLGLGFFAKPSSFAFVPIVVCVALGITFIRDVFLTKRLHEFAKAISNGLLHLVLSLWLPAIYVISNWRAYSYYFYLAMLDPDNIKAFAGNLNLREHLVYYFTGSAGEYMFGDLLWAYVGIIAIGLAAASMRGDRPFIGRQIELLPMIFVKWLLPTVPESKNTLFGAPFAFLFVFMLVMAVRSIYETAGGFKGAIVISLLSFFLLVSGTSSTRVANTSGFYWYNPEAHIVREKWPEAMERLRAVTLGNSPNYRDRSVYQTNSSYYFTPVLQYFFLKKDPTLNWTFPAMWTDPNPEHHIDFIHRTQQDFVVAGERGNGLTYGPGLVAGASAAEDAVLSALRTDPNYMVLDRFYGPTGRTITVFQRRIAFGGWRPLSGLSPTGGTKQPWISDGTVTHLEAYAPIAIPAELVIDVRGPALQTVDIIVNRHRLDQLSLDSSGKSSFMQSINLVAGTNDIIFQYSSNAPITFDRLMIIRKFDGEG